jgi:pyrroline-5-carboxylate reductase
VAQIVLFGGGRMGGALLRGWLAGGIDPVEIAVVDPAPSEALVAAAEESGFALNPPLEPQQAEVVVIAVKPQKVDDVREAVAIVADAETLIVSIMAGKTLFGLTALFPATGRIVRAMPNLPAAIGQGMTVAVAGPDCTAEDRALAEELLAGTGAFEWLDEESQIDAATGLSGSGPAYVFYLTECLTEAGIRQGLAPALAARLARATVEGAGALLAATTDSPAKLRADVTSPAGTTEAGLRVLMADGLVEEMVARTVAAATERARELAG